MLIKNIVNLNAQTKIRKYSSPLSKNDPNKINNQTCLSMFVLKSESDLFCFSGGKKTMQKRVPAKKGSKKEPFTIYRGVTAGGV